MSVQGSQRNDQNETTPLIRQNIPAHPSPCSCNGELPGAGGHCEQKSDTKASICDDDNAHATHFIDITPSKFWVVFGSILLSIVLSFFDGSLLESIHPVISSHFHVANSASWLSTGFLLTCTVFQPIIGQISDIFGRRVPYLVSIAIFFISTIWCGTAWSFGSFLSARLLCGVGASGIIALGSIICSDLIYIEHRGMYQSYLSLAYGLGNCLGLAFGGVIVDSLGWRAAFGVQLPMLCALFAAAYFTLPSNLGPQLARQHNINIRQALGTIDITGSFFLVLGVTALMLGLNLGGNVFPWSHPIVVSSLIVFCLVSVPFVKAERSSPNPAIPLPLLTTAPHANLILGNFFAGISINTILFNAPLFFQAVKLESATSSGFRLLPASVGLMISSLLTGIFMAKTRQLKPILLLGIFWLIGSSACSGILGVNAPDWVSVVVIAMAAFSQGALYPPTMMGVLSTSAQDDQAVITTTLSLLRSLGWVMGVAISSLVFQNALGALLYQTVTGPNKADIILRVRKSIKEIAQLDPIHQSQVVNAYETALRLTFLSSVIWGIIVLLLAIPVKLPRLGHKK
ncbi:multidrug resistance protein fnx1 [Histoplasma ohiense]|nr:multidrug resistance protein fnx1 [Histoplasma ohiense (nom. inval.)]